MFGCVYVERWQVKGIYKWLQSFTVHKEVCCSWPFLAIPTVIAILHWRELLLLLPDAALGKKAEYCYFRRCYSHRGGAAGPTP